MRHARPGDLDPLEPLLQALRGLPGLKEPRRGVFYRAGRAFLHFHEHEGAMYADLRGGEDWERLDARPARWAGIVRRAARVLKS